MTDETPTAGEPGDDRRRKRLHRGFIALTLVSALVLLTIGSGKYYVDHTVGELQSASSQILPSGAPKVIGRGNLTKKPPTGQPFTVLILGTDSRAGTTSYGPDSAACGCSDTIILARVNPQTEKVSLLSIPRDTRVHVNGSSAAFSKINSAYGKGPDNTVATIQNQLNIDINHWVVLDLAGFKSIVDAIGGIKMDFPYKIYDKNAGLYITQTGCQTVNGTTALAISRGRELKYLDPKTGNYVFDPTYEYGRARRQQILMRLIAAHTVKKSLSNPLTAKNVIDTFTSDNRLAVDNQVSASELENLAVDFAGFDATGMESFTLPTVTTLIYDAGAGKKLDFEILQPTADVATIQAWYNATLPTPKTTATSAPTTTPKGAATPTTAGTPTTAPAPSTSSATTTIEPNQPRPWDPRPCT